MSTLIDFILRAISEVWRTPIVQVYRRRFGAENDAPSRISQEQNPPDKKKTALSMRNDAWLIVILVVAVIIGTLIWLGFCAWLIGGSGSDLS